VMAVNDLRLTEVQISRELSWERTAQDLAEELVSNPRVNALSHCAHVIVSLGTDGALLLSRRDVPGLRSWEEKRPKCHLFFDPRMIEGMWAEEHPGGAVGYTTCLTAAVALQLMSAEEGASPELVGGIRRGLAAMRSLHLLGYGATGERIARAELRFPTDRIAAQLVAGAGGEAFSVVSIPAPPSPDWRILESRYPEGLGQLAPAVALEGAESVLTDVPLGRFGALLTVDRTEIEGFQSVRALIREYGRAPQSRPLSIAVFGPPGAGKSFGVVQVAKSLAGNFQKLEFNLSQLGEPSALHGALHQVRDVGLGGGTPLVFWDEFDTDDLAWLRYFLVPMQDGTFQEGEIVHPIGRAVFVFAGGTSRRMEDFSATAKAAVAAKGPDFLSRLKGYVDIIGPNPRDDDPEADPYHQIRRAILLRSILQRQRPTLIEARRAPEGGPQEIVRIDRGVLRAFLRTRTYKHGARSLESVVAMSALHGKDRFERSSLPARAQLDLHVDAEDFLDLAKRHEPDQELLETLAEATHIRYCARMLAQGHRWVGDAPGYLEEHELLRPFSESGLRNVRPHSTLVPWDVLPEDVKGQNRDQVRNIPSQLEAIGYLMRRARAEGPGSARFEPDGQLVELLAEREHERWLKQKLDAGWRWGRIRDDAGKEHPDIAPWRALDEPQRKRRYGAFADRVGEGEISEADREKDREIAQEMGETVAAAGYEIVKLREPGVVVGVTGHRILTEIERLSEGLSSALARIDEACPGEPLSVLSALAEGADRLVAERVLEHPNARLLAVLPVPAADYETDFRSPASRQHFRSLLDRADEVIELTAVESRDSAYDAAGRYVLEHCDVLVTVWDGRDAQGEGGTGGNVSAARERGLPIAWIHAGNRRPGTEEPTSLGEEQGQVSFENL
jgi:RyR domain